MTDFELFFSLFGLILGLAIASVAAGASDVLRERKRIKIGRLTPILIAFLLCDLTSFWISSWTSLQHIRVGFPSMLWALAMAVIYFFSATAALPKRADEWPSLDEYYFEHYRWVLGGVLLANVGLMVLAAVISDGGLSRLFIPAAWTSFVFCGVLIAMLIFRQRPVHYAGYAILFAGYVAIIAHDPSLR
jgi:hypothetical protein